jgi:hypothetical protein
LSILIKQVNSKSKLSKKTRQFLMLIHHFLLATHLVMIIAHSFKTGFFGIEFWLTLIVNILLLIDLELWFEKLSSSFGILKKKPKKTSMD